MARRRYSAPSHPQGTGPAPQLTLTELDFKPYRYTGNSDGWEDGDGEFTSRGQLEAIIWEGMRRWGVTTRHPIKFTDHILAAIHDTHAAPAREATPLDDPYLRYAGLPFTAPRGWLEDHEGDL